MRRQEVPRERSSPQVVVLSEQLHTSERRQGPHWLKHSEGSVGTTSGLSSKLYLTIMIELLLLIPGKISSLLISRVILICSVHHAPLIESGIACS